MSDAPVASDEPPLWPFHERLFGVGLRTLPFVAFGLIMFCAGVRAGLVACAGLLAGSACAFLLERPDASWRGAIARWALAGALSVPAVVLAAAWGRAFAEGGPGSGYAALGTVLTEVGGELPLWMWRGLGAGLLLAPVAVARLGGRSYTHQVAQGTLPAAAGGLMGALVAGWVGCGAAATATLMLTPLAGFGAGILALFLALGDRLATRVDPRAPTAPPTDPLRNGAALTASLLGGAILAPLLVGDWGRPKASPDEIAAREVLLRLADAQRRFLEQSGAGQAAASTLEAWTVGLVEDRVAPGVGYGYLFRLVRSRAEPDRWAAAADPVTPGPGPALHWAVGPLGLQCSRSPIPLDPDECTSPPSVATETVAWERAPPRAWTAAVLCWFLAWPLAFAGRGRLGALLSLAVASGVGGCLAHGSIPGGVCPRFPLFLELAGDAGGLAWVIGLAALAAAPLALGRLRWRGVEAGALLGAGGGAIVAGAMLVTPLPHDASGAVGAHLFGLCLGAGGLVGVLGGWVELRLRPASHEPPRLVGLVGLVLAGFVAGHLGGMVAVWALAPPIAVDGPAARTALLAIHRGQSAEPVASLTELRGVDDAVLSGVAHGHVFRYGRHAGGWTATADPMGPGEHLAIDASGELRVGDAPFPLGPSPP